MGDTNNIKRLEDQFEYASSMMAETNAAIDDINRQIGALMHQRSVLEKALDACVRGQELARAELERLRNEA